MTPQEPEARAETPTRILFVDDEVSARAAFSRSMTRHGFEVDLAAGAVEAIRKAELQYYPVIVTDLRMPGMDGLSLIAQLHPVHTRTTFIILTGVPEIDLRRDHGVDKAIASIVAKPWNDDELAAVITRAAQLAVHDTSDLVNPSSGQGQTSVILLVEDDPDHAILTTRLLKKISVGEAEIEHVERLDGALERVRQRSYQMIITDLSLPDARGLDAVAQLHAAAAEVPIVVLSGLGDERQALQALQLGAQDYLVKGHLDQSLLQRSIRYSIQRKRAERQLAHLAHHDQLTGLANRINLRDRISNALGRARRHGEVFGVMFMDLDRFKSVNDTLGHEAGDLLLQEVGDRIRSAVREYDTVARLGGDEFAVLIEPPASAEIMVSLGERVLEALRSPIRIKSEHLAVTSSVGIAIFPEAGDTIETLLNSADAAMYQAKARGRNNIQVCSGQSSRKEQEHHQLKRELSEGLVRGRFKLHYQPQVDLRNQRLTGFEALLRFSRSDGALVQPGAFIPALEETGLIREVGLWTIQEACTSLRAWLDEGNPKVRMAINMSAIQFEDPDLLRHIQRALARAKLPPELLELEITESILMRDTVRTATSLSSLRGLGVRIAIDDFGTGYSSLAYLNRFSVTTLKIDRSFVRDLHTSARGERQIVAAIIALGHNLGLEIIAEGIEAAAQLELLQQLGCDQGQGFLLGLPEDVLEAVTPATSARSP